ncbi:hypothetical protein JVU11DRAFT_2652 [Chiua virens]|nr:hypothetical protein JVU11DRAFT_2652 [Chiua virens]
MDCHWKPGPSVDDMTAMGIPPDRQSYHHLLHACRWSSADTMWQVVDEMKKQDIEPDEDTYALIIGRATATESLELALQHMHEMDTLGLVPRLKTTQDIIKLAADMDMPKLAYRNRPTISIPFLPQPRWRNMDVLSHIICKHGLCTRHQDVLAKDRA